MLATISHEQMNPLNSIINFTQYMRNKTKEYFGMEEDTSVSLDSSKVDQSSSELDLSPTCTPFRLSDLKKQYRLLSIVLSSSNLIYLLNSSILSLA
mmetsp:Transcript_23695/g.36370  ORF Transcript_23695/g.36370 Transcript_23695/m.36370 type:complete len:96 (+) Transcript_23695:547-834(+)